MLADMASPRKTGWRTFTRFAENVVRTEGPRLLRQLQQVPAVQQGIQRGLEQGIKITVEAIVGGVPTAHRARKVQYAPDLDGRADPGEVVWTWVVYEDDPTRGKDRPVLVVGRDRETLLGLMLSSQDRHSGDRDWLGIGVGPWDYDGRPSWVRLDRVLDVPEEGIRREGAILDRPVFDLIAARLRADYSWG